jgi:hypothetical protein
MLAVLVACKVSHELPPQSGDDAPPPDAEPDAAKPIECGDLLCDANAVCLTGPARCECKPGFTGDGMSCGDIDECAVATACPAACLNLNGSFECYVPQTCEDVKAKVPGFTSGDVTLYLGGAPARPWTAFCAANGNEYLSLTSAMNYSQYTRDPGADVRTTFTKIRIIPGNGMAAMIDIDDKTYSASTGSLPHGGETVTSMPYGVAMDCENGPSPTGVAEMDLAGTKFAISDPFENRGSSPQGSSVVQNNGRRVSLVGGGNCGWRSPAPAPFNPFNSIGPSPILDLTYAP